MKASLLGGLGFVLLAACGEADAPVVKPPAEDVSPIESGMDARIDAALSGMVERGELAGASALVWKDDEEVYFGAFGMADVEADRPMQRDTLVRLYSMTKPVTGVALMTLHEQGMFRLDDPLSKYFPEFEGIQVYAGVDEAGNPVFEESEREPLVLDIMRHTAGLTNGWDDDTVVGIRFRDLDPFDPTKDLQQMAGEVASVPLLYQPGERWLYSPAVDLQAALVERLTGRSYWDYLRETVLDPLGMHDTAYFVPEDKRDRMAMVYVVNGPGDFVPEDPDEYGMRLPFIEGGMTPGGYGLVSTLDDYMRFARMLVNEGELDGVRILKPETVRLMATDHMPDTVTDTYWLPGKGQVGFGLDFAVRIAPPVDETEKYGVPGEFFWDGRASTLFWVDPENDLTAVLFVQYLPWDVAPAHMLFRDAVYGVREFARVNPAN